MKSWIKELREKGPKNIVIAIAGNKVDLEEERQVEAEGNAVCPSVELPLVDNCLPLKCLDARKFCDDIGAVFLETSALTAVGVNTLFQQISKC